MKSGPKRRLLTTAIALALLGGLPAPAPAGQASDSDKEIAGLRATPRIPVSSAAHAAPGHGRGLPPRGKRPKCDKDVDISSQLSGVASVAQQDNGICTSADIDTYATASGSFVVQAGGNDAAFVITDVSTPDTPVRHGPYKWSGRGGKNTYTPDVKAFSQLVGDGMRHFIALSLERVTTSGFCGVVIVDVTSPASPQTVTQIYKNDSSDFWCDVHNSFVEDVDGHGRYIYLTADAPHDMRVVDIANVTELPSTCNIVSGCDVEIGRYIAPGADSNNYVHDVTVLDHSGTVGRRAYLSYWNSGLVIVDADDVTAANAGTAPPPSPTPVVGPGVIDPAGFATHHAFASADGTLLFIQDEFLSSSGQEPVQMWTIDKDPADELAIDPGYVDGLELGADVPANPAHNLEIYEAQPNRLYVGWYKLGLQGWDFTTAGFTRSGSSPRTAVVYHQVQTENGDDEYDGAWGVRLMPIGIHTYVFQSDRRFGLIIDRLT